MGNLASPIPRLPNADMWKRALDEPTVALRRNEVEAFIAAHCPVPDVHVHGADEADVAFCRTVGPQQQAAIAAWAELAAAVVVVDHPTSEGGAPPVATAPGLPVMVAAMLRRPVLEAYLDCAAQVLPGDHMPLTGVLPDSITPCQRSVLAERPEAAATMVRRLVEDPTSRVGVFRPSWRAPFDVLALLAAHDDLADALLAVPLRPTLSSAALAAGIDVPDYASGVRPLSDLQMADWRGLVPSLPSRCLVSTVGLRQDFRAACLLLLTQLRVPNDRSPTNVHRSVPMLAPLAADGQGPVPGALREAWSLLRTAREGGTLLNENLEPTDALHMLQSAQRSIDAARCDYERQRLGWVSGAGAGDANAVLYRLSLDPGQPPMRGCDPNSHMKLLARVRTLLLADETAVASFLSAGAPDVAAALVATCGQPQVAAKVVRDTAQSLVGFELRAAAIRHGAGDGTELLENRCPHGAVRELVMPLFDKAADGAAVLRSLGPDAAAVFGPDAHVLLTASRTAPPAGAPATTDRAECARRWAAVSGGLLDGWPFWEHTLVVGGAVAACLDPLRPLAASRLDRAADAGAKAAGAALPGDIDLVFHSVTPDGASALCAQLQEHAHRVAAARGLCGRSTAAGVAVLLTSRTMTVVFDAPELPRVQVALGHWESVADALQTADVDACCCGLTFVAAADDDDGGASAVPPTVLATGRGALAWACKANVPSGQRHAVRGSPTYELRLWKYARRHGFAVLDVVQKASDDALKCMRAEAQAVQKKASNSLRSGLEWLVFANEGAFTPKVIDALDAIAVTAERPLADVVAAAERDGYLESDNYGGHEEGYVVVKEDQTPPDASAIAFDARRYGLETADYTKDLMEVTHRAYLEDPATRAGIRSSLSMRVLDGVSPIAVDRYRTRWTVAEATIDSDEED